MRLTRRQRDVVALLDAGMNCLTSSGQVIVGSAYQAP